MVAGASVYPRARVDDNRPFPSRLSAFIVHRLRQLAICPSPRTRTTPPATFDALRERIAATIAALREIDLGGIGSLVGRDTRFQAGDMHIDLPAENFLRSFSQPGS